LIRFVIDASAAAEYLLRTPLGQSLDDLLEDAFLMAPALLDAEVMSVLRRALLQKKIEEHRARLALEDLRDWPVDRIPHPALLQEAWKHRHNVSAYDSLYVAAAKLYQATLLTADGPLSRAPGLGIVVQNVRLG
jgi:predicted nucleic acid-binding protein